jgi:hypothetical protein
MPELNPSLLHARLGRRSVLRNGLLVVGAGAFLAACGDREGSTDPGRIGNAAPLPTLPETGEITDVTWVRTLQSLEHSMLALYAGLAEHGGLPGDASPLTDRFVADHERTAAALGGLIGAAGGSEFACENPFFSDRYVAPVLAGIDAEGNDPERDISQIASAFEEWVARSFQAVVAREWDDPALRPAIAVFAGEANRRAAGLALALSPGTVLSPALTGEPLEPDEQGFPYLYAIPARFGQVAGIELRHGAPNQDGAYATVSLQTPGANALVYDSLSC